MSIISEHRRRGRRTHLPNFRPLIISLSGRAQAGRPLQFSSFCPYWPCPRVRDRRPHLSSEGWLFAENILPRVSLVQDNERRRLRWKSRPVAAEPGLCPFLRCIGASPSLAAADVIPFTYRSLHLSGFALSRQPSPFPIRERSALSSLPHVSLTSPSLSLSVSSARPAKTSLKR